MVDCVAVCGDSFGCGSGLPEDRCYEDSFGGQVASKLNLPLRVFARSGCCNFTIYLQVKKILDLYHHKKINPLVIISLTHHSRMIFPIDGTKTSSNVDLSDVDYIGYQPYSLASNPRRNIEFEPKDRPNLMSETISNMNLCLSGHILGDSKIFSNIMDRKWRAIRSYFEELYDDSVKREYDVSIANMMHLMLAEYSIPHVIMGYGKYHFRHIKEGNYLNVHWGKISAEHPDVMNSGHCDENGHLIVADQLLPLCKAQLGLDQ